MPAASPVFSEMAIADYGEVLALWQATENVGLSDADSREDVEAYLARNAGLSLVARHEGRWLEPSCADTTVAAAICTIWPWLRTFDCRALRGN